MLPLRAKVALLHAARSMQLTRMEPSAATVSSLRSKKNGAATFGNYSTDKLLNYLWLLVGLLVCFATHAAAPLHGTRLSAQGCSPCSVRLPRTPHI